MNFIITRKRITSPEASRPVNQGLNKLRHLVRLFFFMSVAVNILDALSEEAFMFFHNLGHRIADVTAGPRLFHFLMLQLSCLCAWKGSMPSSQVV